MLAKSWKKILLIVLIVACLWNIVTKVMYKVSFYDLVNNFKENYKQENNTKKV